MANTGEASRLVPLAEVVVTPSLERWKGRGVYGDGDGDCHDTTQTGV